MEDSKFTKKQIIIIVIGGIIALTLIILHFLGKDDNKVYLVKSSSEFYTVSNCINRYLNYLNAEDSDSLFLLLDKSYKKKNNINNNNVLDKVEKFDELYSFESRKMYQEDINDNVTKYYIYGYLIKNDIDSIGSSDNRDYYFIVYLDSKNSTFSISPYDGKIFEEVKDE